MKINGTPVVDASKKLLITITPRDITKGDTKDPAGCAAAQACLRTLPNCTEARVHLGRTYLKQGTKWTRFITSRPLRSEIIAFDRGGKFEPGEYILSPCQPTKRATGKRQGSLEKKKKPAHLQKPRAKPHTVTGVRQHGANR